MAWVSTLGPDQAQVDYRLHEGAGCGAPELQADAQLAYRLTGERPLMWIGDGLREVGITPGSPLTADQHDAARALMDGRHRHTQAGEIQRAGLRIFTERHQANAAVTEVRRRLTVQVRGRRGRKGNREWELRNRLTRSAARMHGSQLDPMIDDLIALPKRLGAPILTAWNAKEDLLDVLALARTHPDRTVIADRLFRFYDRCAASGLPELQRLATTIETWWPQILAFIRTGITNAGSEGTNRVIKTVARDAYGFRNPDSQRLRTRCATTRKSRGCLNPA